MINFYRNRLLNVTSAAQASSAVKETIPDDFSPLTYPTSLESVRSILVGKGSVDQRAYRTQMALRLAYSTELSTYLTQYVNTFTFDPKNIKHFGKDFTFNIVNTERALQELTGLANFYSEARKRIDVGTFNGLQYIARYHDNSVWRLSAYIVLFLLAAAKQP